MIISDDTLVDLVLGKMAKEPITQGSLSKKIGVSQGHLSKILRKITPLGSSVRTALYNWLGDGKVVREADIARTYLEQLIHLGGAGEAMAMHVLNGALTYVRSLKDIQSRSGN